jgi:hypothetical protein
VDEWLGLWDDPILGNSALDRLANGAHQLVIEGPSYRAKLAPKQRQATAGTTLAPKPRQHPPLSPATPAGESHPGAPAS